MKTTTLLKLMAAALLIVASAVFLAACSSSADEDPAAAGDAAEHVDDAVNGNGADDLASDADADEHSDADADEHSDADADEHDGDDMDMTDPEAHAYLEAAPKDSLFLIDMSLLSFTPSVLEAKVGEVIEIAIQNSEATLHDFTIDEIDADVHISYLGGTGQHEHMEPANEADVHFALTEPASGIVHLKVNEPGEYQFHCSVLGHTESGMFGTLIVTEA